MSDEPKRLFRSRDERMLGGVCGGLGEYLNTDPTIIRILFVIITLFGFAGVFLYLAMWLIVPEEPLDVVSAAPAPPAEPAVAEPAPVEAAPEEWAPEEPAPQAPESQEPPG
jgi:phage shock protein C